MDTIEMDELPKYMSTNALLIDVRLPSDYMLSHLDGAINMPYTNILSMIKNYPKDTSIILYCDYGHQSKRVGRMLTSLGFTNVYNLKRHRAQKSYKQ